MDKNKSEQHIVPKLNNMNKKLEEILKVINTKVAFYEITFVKFIFSLLFVGIVLVILEVYCKININDIPSRCSEWISKFIGFGKKSSQSGISSDTNENEIDQNKVLDKEKKWTEQVAKQGDAEVQYDLGSIYYKQGDYNKAIKYWDLAGKQGHVDAQYNL